MFDMNNPMYKNMLNNMNPDMMKNYSKNIQNMSDDQLKSMMAMSGMGHMDINTFRQMNSQMSNSSNDDLNRMKEAAKMQGGNAFNKNQTNNQPNTNNNTNNSSSNTNTNNNTNTKPQTSQKNDKNIKQGQDAYDIMDNTPNSGTFKGDMEKLKKIKDEGNANFKVKKYSEAKEKYYEMLNNINITASKTDQYVRENINEERVNKELTDLKVSCRLNIANCLLKQEEYDMVILECSKIIKLDSGNFKAHYRTGVSHFFKKDLVKAKENFDKTLSISKPNDDVQSVNDYLEKIVKQNAGDYIKNENNLKSKKEKTDINETDNIKIEYKPKPTSNNKNFNENITKSDNREEEKTDKKSDKNEKTEKKTLSKILENEFNQEINTENVEKKSPKIEEDDNIKIETVKEQSKNTHTCDKHKNYNTNSNTTTTNTQPNMFNMDQKTIEESKSKFNNMDESQIDMMTNMFSGMDNNTIKSMMQAQGMNMSDDQINLMKNGDMIKSAQKQMKQNPDLFNNMANMQNRGNLMNNNTMNTSNVSENLNPVNTSTTNNTSNPMPQMPQMPNLGDLPKNMDMKSMMDFVQKNPDILKMMGPQMANMMGGQNGDANPGMASALSTVIWLLGLPQRIKKFITSPSGLLISGLSVYFIYSYFWGS